MANSGDESKSGEKKPSGGDAEPEPMSENEPVAGSWLGLLAWIIGFGILVTYLLMDTVNGLLRR
jgi:hypothetical protein